MRLHVHLNVQIAWRSTVLAGLTLACEAYAIARINTCWHLNRQRFVFTNRPAPMTGIARIFNLFACALTARTRLLHREKPLLHANLPMAATSCAVDRLRAFLSTRTVTGFAGHSSRNLYFDRRSTHRVF